VVVEAKLVIVLAYLSKGLAFDAEILPTGDPTILKAICTHCSEDLPEIPTEGTNLQVETDEYVFHNIRVSLA